jgi:AraC-like DNA-binding protein
MPYFEGLTFITHNHLPQCQAWVDCVFTKYALNFCGGGRIRWRSHGGAEQTLTAPVAWWVWPGQRFQYGNFPDESWDHYYVSFNGPRARRMAGSGLIPCTPTSPARTIVADAERFRTAFEQLHLALEAEPQSVHAVHLLEGLFLQLHLQPPVATTITQYHAPQLARLVDDIRTHPQVEWDFEAEARRMGLSYAHLRRLFKQIYRLAPQQCVIKTRMDTAARLLRAGSDPIKHVAESAGYEDVFHFTKLFKRTYGLAPGRYRQQAQLLG